MSKPQASNPFLKHTGVKLPVICGPMYPCSNPELVAAVSASGGMGVIQPVSLSYVHGYELAAGIDYIQSLTDQPLGMNLLIEKSSRKYHQRMQQALDVALQKGIRFFITSLGKPDWVVKQAHAAGAVVYHDVTEHKWALKAIDVGVDGLIAVNNRAGGHAGGLGVEALYEQLEPLGLPVVCAGGVSEVDGYCKALNLGYAAVQMGTRFIATQECNASEEYKRAIVNAQESDIVLSERITGVPVSVINTPHIQQQGVKSSRFEGWMLKHPRFKYWIRTWLALKSFRALKSSLHQQKGARDYWQAGKSVHDIHAIQPVSEVMQSFIEAAC